MLSETFANTRFLIQYSGTLTLTNAHIHAAKEGLRHRRLDSSSMSFNNTGDLFGVVYQHAYPTIYSIREQNPLAVLTGDYTPQGERVQRREDTYSTACTTKHCSFQGDYLATGSDDFRGYVWKVPPRRTMMDRRRVMSREEMDEGGFATANGYPYDVRSGKFGVFFFLSEQCVLLSTHTSFSFLVWCICICIGQHSTRNYLPACADRQTGIQTRRSRKHSQFGHDTPFTPPHRYFGCGEVCQSTHSYAVF